MATVKVKSMAELKNVLNKHILSSMKTIARKEERNLKESIQEKVYNAYIPKYYKRDKNYGLKDSVAKEVVQNGSETTAKIFHDTKKMRQLAPTKYYHMGTHHSTVKSYHPQEYAYFIPITIEEGTSGTIFGEGAFTRPRRYFEPFVDKLKDTFSESLRAELIRKGLTIRRRG